MVYPSDVFDDENLGFIEGLRISPIFIRNPLLLNIYSSMPWRIIGINPTWPRDKINLTREEDYKLYGPCHTQQQSSGKVSIGLL